jgi:hypothetical protein
MKALKIILLVIVGWFALQAVLGLLGFVLTVAVKLAIAAALVAGAYFLYQSVSGRKTLGGGSRGYLP